jgi:hypothetical protein
VLERLETSSQFCTCRCSIPIIDGVVDKLARCWQGESSSVVPCWGEYSADQFRVHAVGNMRPAPGRSRRAGHAIEWRDGTALRSARLLVRLGWQRRFAGVLVGAVARAGPVSFSLSKAPRCTGRHGQRESWEERSLSCWGVGAGYWAGGCCFSNWGLMGGEGGVRERWDLFKILHGRFATRYSNHERQTGHCSNAQVAEISEGCWYSVHYFFDQN